MARMTGRRIAWAGTVVRFDDGTVWAVEFDGRTQWVQADITLTQDYHEAFGRWDRFRVPLLQEVRVELCGQAARWMHGEESAPTVPQPAGAVGGAPLAIERGNG